MALPENDKKQVEKKEKPSTKVIIRRLPPSMDQETFLNQVSPIPDYNYIYTSKADYSLGEFAFSRVYINFVNFQDVYDFKERFDNYVFVDSKGHEYPAVVEFAPFQKIPKKRGKIRMDPKCSTIESDPIYQEFVESLNKPQEQDEKPEYTLQLSSVTNENKNDVTTPLLEYIKNKRAQRMRIREVRREERKRREFDRRKERYDDRKKVSEEKPVSKTVYAKSKPDNSKERPEVEEVSEVKTEEKPEKAEKTFEKSYFKNRDRKFEDRKFDSKRKEIKLRYPKKEYPDHRDYKRSEDYKEREYRPRHDDFKKEEKGFQKKVKKYSERREECKMEAQKAEQMKNEKIAESKKDANPKESEENAKVPIEKTDSPKTEVSNTPSGTPKKSDAKSKEMKPSKKENISKNEERSSEGDSRCFEMDQKKKNGLETHSQRRIRNKDRPTIAIYRPGMLSRRKQTDTDSVENKESKSDK